MYRVTIALRLLAVLGVWTAASLWLPVASSSHDISFTECSSDPEQPFPEPTLTPAPPADPTPTPGEVPQNCVPSEGEVIAVPRTLRFEVDADALRPIRQVHAYLESEDEDVPDPGEVELACLPEDQDPETPGCQYLEDAPDEGVYAFQWDPQTTTPYNGSYTFRAYALSSIAGNEHDAEARREQLIVDNPPQRPGAPSIIVATENSVTLEWEPAPEPDVLSYTLYRARTEAGQEPRSRDFEAVLETTKAAARNEVNEPGRYWYRVSATRRSVLTPDEGISSPLSARSKAAVVAGIDATPPPEGEEVTPPPPRPIPVPRAPGRPPPVPEAPFSAYLPFDTSDLEATDAPVVEEIEEPGRSDPRGPVLPVAVGAFLVTSALAVGRMPF